MWNTDIGMIRNMQYIISFWSSMRFLIRKQMRTLELPEKLAIWGDDGVPGRSAGNYVTPTWSGLLYVGSDKTGAGQTDAFYSNLLVENKFAVPNRGSLYVNLFDEDLTPEVGATSAALTRATAWSCLASGGASMVALGVNAPCYYGQGEDTLGPDGDAIGIRVGGAATTKNQGLEGLVGAVPTGWTSGGAGRPQLTADPFYGTWGVGWAETGDPSQFIYESTGDTGAGNVSMQFYLKQDAAATAGSFLLDNFAVGLFAQIAAGPFAYRRVSKQKLRGVAPEYPVVGSANGIVTAPTAGAFVADAPQYEMNTLFPSPYCDGGAPPTVCGPESLTIALTAGELPAAAGEIRMVVTPYWASDEAGIDRVAFFGDADFKIWYDESAETWVFTAGGQVATSAVQVFPRDSSHYIIATWSNGAPLSLQVDGQTAVVSGGNYSTATLDATKYLGSSNGGGDEISAWISHFEVRP